MNRKAEIGGTLFLLVLGVLFTVETSLIPKPMLMQDLNTSPSFLPVTVGIIFSLLALAQLVTVFRATAQRPTANKTMAEWYVSARPVLIVLGILVAYVLLMQIIGWLISTVFMISAVLKVAAARTQRKASLSLIIVISVSLTALVFLIFDLSLGVPMPRGIYSLETLLGL